MNAAMSAATPSIGSENARKTFARGAAGSCLRMDSNAKTVEITKMTGMPAKTDAIKPTAKNPSLLR